ncbi:MULTISPECIES: hypothetical protein [unclassified Streptomyces]|uniref:hypothetical protein n=1 Tax=unclassified Streptomyces TaxID=2593676 RepID=UPI002E25EB80
MPGAYERILTAPAFHGRPEAVFWWERRDGSYRIIREAIGVPPGIRARAMRW